MEAKFKVGDWVNLVRDDGIIFDTFIYDEDWNGKNGFSLELWIPKEGEWCWFIVQEEPVLRQYHTEKHNSYLAHNKCEPFIGQLPTFIKDKQ